MRVNFFPRRVRKRCRSALSPLQNVPLADERYLTIASPAACPIGTMRSFEPLPVQRTSSAPSGNDSSVRSHSSLTRRPHPYRSSSMARSRRSLGSIPFTESTRRCIASSGSIFGRTSPFLGASSPSIGSAAIRRIDLRCAKNSLIEVKARARDDARLDS